MPPRRTDPGIRRRSLLFAAAASATAAPFASLAAPILTPRELSERYRDRVDRSLAVPRNEALIYGGLAELQLSMGPDVPMHEPQYLLVVDSCPTIQVAFLFWRLLPGHYQLVGASPASTGDPVQPGCVATPCGVFPQAQGFGAGGRASRIYDFGLQRARLPQGRGLVPLQLQAHAAQGRSRSRLGTAQSDGRVLLPPSLVDFLDAFGVLDASRGPRTQGGEELPFAGRYLVVLDSEREDRPDWAAA